MWGACRFDSSQIDVESGSISMLLEGHQFGKVTAISTHASRRVFVSSGSDGVVRLWDLQTRRLLLRQRMEQAVTSVCFNFDGLTIASGTDNGRLVILKSKSLKACRERKDRYRAGLRSGLTKLQSLCHHHPQVLSKWEAAGCRQQRGRSGHVRCRVKL